MTPTTPFEDFGARGGEKLQDQAVCAFVVSPIISLQSIFLNFEVRVLVQEQRHWHPL